MSKRQIKQRLHRSRRQEARGAEALDGRVQPASGAFWSRKGDVRAAEWLVEYKRSDAESIILRKQDLRKILFEAAQAGVRYALGLEISGDDYIVLAAEDFSELVEKESSTCSISNCGHPGCVMGSVSTFPPPSMS